MAEKFEKEKVWFWKHNRLTVQKIVEKGASALFWVIGLSFMVFLMSKINNLIVMNYWWAFMVVFM